MEALLLPLALLACPVGMGAMMYFMSRVMMGGGREPAPPQPSPAETGGDLEMRLALLQAEREVLETKMRLVAERDSQRDPAPAARDEVGR